MERVEVGRLQQKNRPELSFKTNFKKCLRLYFLRISYGKYISFNVQSISQYTSVTTLYFRGPKEVCSYARPFDGNSPQVEVTTTPEMTRTSVAVTPTGLQLFQ